MQNKIMLTPDQFKIFEQGNMIESVAGTFYNFPYWLKKDGKDEVYDLFARSEIPGIQHGYQKGGLKDKYEIRKTNGKPVDPESWYFLLRVDHDIHAQKAAMCYADSVENENPVLAEELRTKVRTYNPNL